jgi:hypothetical protein
MTLRNPRIAPNDMVVGSFADQQALQVQGDFIVTDAAGTNILVADVSVPSLTFDGVAIAIDFADSDALVFGTGNDISFAWDGTDFDVTQAAENSSIKWGVSGAGIDQLWYGDTAAANMTWDQSANSLILGDAAILVFGTGSDISIAWDGTDLDITGAGNSVINVGVDGTGLDFKLFGDTASAYVMWDGSADTLLFAGVAKLGAHRVVTVAGGNGTVNITSATSGQYHIVGGGDTAVTLPAVAGTGGCVWHFIMNSDHEVAFVAPANTMVVFNDATATSITYTTAGEQIGVAATIFSDGTLYYFMAHLPAEAATASVA